MPAAARIVLPEDVAAELVAEGLAVPALVTRGGPVVDAIQTVVDGVNFGSSVVTVALVGHALSRTARRVVSRVRRGEASVAVQIAGPSGNCSVVLEPGLSLDEAAAVLADAYAKVT